MKNFIFAFLVISVPCAFAFAVCEKLGPVPIIDCMQGKLIPSHHEGKPLEKRDGKFYLDGKHATGFKLEKLDRPQLASPDQTGGINARLGHLRVRGIEWVFICRSGGSGVNENEYSYAPVGLIGFNPETGETCFTDMKANTGSSGETEKENTEYCARCHSNNSPWILTPHLNQSAIGGDGSMDVIPLLPKEKLATPGWGYKIYGITEKFRKTLLGVQPKNPDGSPDKTCTSCHTISSSFLVPLYDAVGKYTEHKGKTNLAKKFSLNYWMPLDPLVLNKDQWNAKYGSAVERLLYCAENDDRSKCEKRVELVLPVE